jgi:hypothetical protein
MKKIVYLSGILALALPTMGNCSSGSGGYDRQNGDPSSLDMWEWPNWDEGETGETKQSKFKIYLGTMHWIGRIRDSGMSDETLERCVADINGILNKVNTMEERNHCSGAMPLAIDFQEDHVKTMLSYHDVIAALQRRIEASDPFTKRR